LLTTPRTPEPALVGASASGGTAENGHADTAVAVEERPAGEQASSTTETPAPPANDKRDDA
jgi:hypothetical protein